MIRFDWDADRPDVITVCTVESLNDPNPQQHITTTLEELGTAWADLLDRIERTD